MVWQPARSVQFVGETLVLVLVHLHLLSLDVNKDRGPPVPMVVHYKLIGFADIELQVVIVTPCVEALSQSSVLLCKNSLSEDSMFLTGNE